MLVDHRAQLLVLHILHLGVRGRSSWAADRLAMGAAPEVCLCRPPSRRTSEGATWREQKVVDFPFCQISVLGKVDDLLSPPPPSNFSFGSGPSWFRELGARIFHAVVDPQGQRVPHALFGTRNASDTRWSPLFNPVSTSIGRTGS